MSLMDIAGGGALEYRRHGGKTRYRIQSDALHIFTVGAARRSVEESQRFEV